VFWTQYIKLGRQFLKLGSSETSSPEAAHLQKQSDLTIDHLSNSQQGYIMAISVMSLQSTLQSFVNQTPDIQGAVLVSLDGLPLASYLPTAMDEERVSAMSATMLSLGERIGKELGRGDADRLFVEGDQGYAVLTACGSEAVLLVLAASGVKQGLLMLEIKRITAEIKAALS
jgi:uncharacterized protein